MFIILVLCWLLIGQGAWWLMLSVEGNLFEEVSLETLWHSAFLILGVLSLLFVLILWVFDSSDPNDGC